MLGIYPGNRKMDVIPHTHTYFFILWIRKGEGVHTINFENITIKNNQIFFIAPGEVHKILYNNDYSDDIAIPFTEDLLNLLPLNIANWIRFELFNNIGKPNIANIDLKTIKVLSMWIKQLEFLLANPNGSTKYCVAFQLSIMLLYLKENATWSNKFAFTLDGEHFVIEIFLMASSLSIKSISCLSNSLSSSVNIVRFAENLLLMSSANFLSDVMSKL